MKQSKLYQLLESFRQKDWTAATDFIASPYFNKNNRCTALFQILKQQFEQPSKSDFSVAYLSRVLFKGKKNPEGYLRVVIVQLTQLLEQFLAQEEWKKKPLYSDHLLNQNLLNRKRYHHFLNLYRKKMRSLEADSSKKMGLESYQDAFLQSLDYQLYLHTVQSRKISKIPIEQTIQKLDHYYLLQRLQLMVQVISVEQLSNADVHLPVLPILNELIKISESSDSKLLELYYLSIQMLLNNNTSDEYTNLSKKIEQYAHSISKQELNVLYTVLINFFIMTHQAGSGNYRKVLDLYKKMVEYRVFRIQQYITEGKFKNIVTLGCLFQEFEWTEDFIEKYAPFLEPVNQKNIYHFNKGAFYFFKKEFEKAQSHLIKVEPFELFYTVDTKSLMCRIYYELGEYLAAFRSLHILKEFVRKQKQLSAHQKKSYLNFVTVLLKLCAEKEKYQIQNAVRERLLEKLNAYPSIHYKQWLAEKIGAL